MKIMYKSSLKEKDFNSDKVLSEDQKEMLFFIYQEEKVARDVYIALAKIYKNEHAFTLMQVSEQRRVDSARDLCSAYGVETSNIDEGTVGEFESTVLQLFYDACTEKGARSLFDAFKIAELIEITDIDDLEQASIGMPDDVVSVYEDLRRGSLRRLDSFQSALAKAA